MDDQLAYLLGLAGSAWFLGPRIPTTGETMDDELACLLGVQRRRGLPRLIRRLLGQRSSRELTTNSLRDLAESLETMCDGTTVRNWRTEQLVRLGIPASLAEAAAGDIDWHQVAALVHRGCPPGLALQIVQ